MAENNLRSDAFRTIREAAGRDQIWSFVIIIISLAQVSVLTLFGASHYLRGILGVSLPATSGAAILAISFVLTAAIFGCGLIILRRQAEFGALIDDIGTAKRGFVGNEALAKRIHERLAAEERAGLG